ncbi:MAG: hypothetical protein KatS3mg129_2142 [Leptospiraceae bacterium]|nr:MAG: hypothetical protein KatS3mg129_2142 [Leptospiraceae bacterium]
MKNINILIVDDSPSFILYVKELFSKNGYDNIFVTYDKEMAEKILKENKIHIILLDIELNTISEGFQFGEYIQIHYDLPVIYITGKNEDEIKQLIHNRNKNIPFYGLLFKPFQFSELEVLMENALKNYLDIKIKKHSYKRILEFIPQPAVILFRNRILYYNNTFKEFIKDVFSIENIPSDIAEIFPDLNLIIKEFNQDFQEKYEGYIEIQSFKIKIELLYLEKDSLQIIFYPEKWNITKSKSIQVEKFSFIIEIMNKMMEGVFILNEKREFIFVNPMFLKQFQYNENELIGKNVKILRSSRLPYRFYIQIWREVEQNGFYEGKIYLVTKDGNERTDWVYMNKIYDQNKNKTYYMGIITDLNQKLKQEEYLFYLAHYDELTELPNRRYFNEVLKKEIYQSKRNSTRFALIFIDLDNFKKINDNYGHLIGDKVLQFFAYQLQQSLRKTDSIFRYAGDEFCIIINQLENTHSLIPVLEKILNITKVPFIYNDYKIYLSLSIGVAIFPDDFLLNYQDSLKLQEDEILSKLIQIADKKMYEAKKGGGNRYRFYSEALNQYSLFRETLNQNYKDILEIYFYNILNQNNQLVAIQPIALIKEQFKNIKNNDTFLSLYLESNEEKEKLFLDKLLEEFNHNSSFIKELVNQNISFYFRFSSKIILQKNILQKFLQWNSNIIMELIDREMQHLIQYHSTYLKYLFKNPVKVVIKQSIYNPLFSFKNIPMDNIFAIKPEIRKNLYKFSEEEQIKLKIFLENMTVFKLPVLLEAGSEEDLSFLNQYNYNYYKNKVNPFRFDELKSILHKNIAK